MTETNACYFYWVYTPEASTTNERTHIINPTPLPKKIQEKWIDAWTEMLKELQKEYDEDEL
jgi:hypothetical protein